MNNQNAVFIQVSSPRRVITSLSDVRGCLLNLQTEIIMESGSKIHNNPNSVKHVVGNKIIHLLQEARSCGVIDREFPLGVWTSPDIKKVGNNGLSFIYDIRAFGFLIADEKLYTKKRLLDQLDAIIGPLNGMEYNNILNANSQQEYLRIISED